jgi:hypothetical protein
MPLALLGLLWIAVTCVHAPADDSASLGNDEPLRVACERVLASLAADGAAGRRVTVTLPHDVEPAARALRATGRGERVAALEAALERTARLALVDARPWLEAAAAGADSDGSSAAAFRAEHEGGLRDQVAAAAPARLAETGALDALEQVRGDAERLPLPRRIDLDLVSLVTDQAVTAFFDALGAEERHLRGEREALGGG